MFEIRTHCPYTVAAIDRTIRELSFNRRQAEAKDGTPEPAEMVLVLPNGPVAPAYRALLQAGDISVWDINDLEQRARKTSDALLSERASHIKRLFLDLRSPQADSHVGARLVEHLTKTRVGKADWPLYQKLCGNILSYLFCPPLEVPVLESRTASGVNRRDIVLSNYAVDGFWRFMHRAYQAEYVVVDAKNLAQRVRKGEVLQLANYLSFAGTGLFGMILTRKGEEPSSVEVRREQWRTHRKMILVLSDIDIHQMISNRRAGVGAEEVVRQHIEELRLSL
jgi:hypothetical protein